MKSKEGSVRHIAKDLKVSISTVSRAINTPELVKKETREMVLDYLRENNITITTFDMKAKKNVIGLTFADSSSLFTHSVIAAIEKILADTPFQLMLFNLQSRRDVAEYFKEHPDYLKKIDGLFVYSSTLTKEGSDFFKSLGMPLVLFHNRCEGEECILTNNYKGCQNAATYLQSRGYKNTAFVKWIPEDEQINDRFQGFTSVCDVKKEHIVEVPLSSEGGYKATEYLLSLEDKPDSIFYGCDAMAAGGLRYMREHNINVSNDIGIMGFDNLPIAELMGITTMNQFVSSKIAMAVNFLLDRINGKETKEIFDEVSITPQLIVRTSLK